MIRYFELGVEEIIRLKKKLQLKIEDLEDMAHASEVSNRKKLADVSMAFEVGPCGCGCAPLPSRCPALPCGLRNTPNPPTS